jgi:NADPH:quinone reductase-like Zn-dependent oxidoreductase
VGTVIQESRSNSRIKKGDVVFSPSTDYRDLRKAAYQEFAIAANFNVSRIPCGVSREKVAGLGVAFVAAALSLGISLGCNFSSVVTSPKGPNLLEILHSLNPEAIPADQRKECLEGIQETEAPKKGDWILIWGGSSTSAQLISQLSKLIGLRVIKVVDVGKHGDRLSQGHADLLVDGYDPERAIEIIRKVTNGNLRFAVDTIGKKTAELSQRAMKQSAEGPSSHLVGLSGIPKETTPGMKYHSIPIKVYHEVPAVGDSLMKWLEALLSDGKLTPPDAELSPGGLEGINDALDRMRKGEISGKRIVIKI